MHGGNRARPNGIGFRDARLPILLGHARAILGGIDPQHASHDTIAAQALQVRVVEHVKPDVFHAGELRIGPHGICHCLGTA